MDSIVGSGRHILRLGDIFSILFVEADLDFIGLLTTQTHLVAHDLVFDGVLQWRTQQHIDALALDKAHLDNALAEATVSLYLNNIGLVARIQF